MPSPPGDASSPDSVGPQISSGVWRFGRYRLDAAERRLTADAEVLALTPKAFDLLLHLVERSDRLVRREDLIAALWPDTFVEDGTLARHVSALRRTIERDAGERFLETVPKSGYRFLGAVREVPPTPARSAGAGQAEGAPQDGVPPPAHRPTRRAPRWLVAALGVALIAGVAGIIALTGLGLRRSQGSPANVPPGARATEPGAQEAYLRARYFLSRRTAVDLRAAGGLFEQALAREPGYADAEAGWATALALLAGSEEAIRNSTAARAHATRAIALDSRCAEAHAALGLLAMNHDGDWAAAEASFRRALEIEPDDVSANHWLGEMLALLGRSDEGLALLERAHRADPASLIVATDIVKALFVAKRYDEAIARAEKVIAIDPGFAPVYVWKGFAYLDRGGPGDAAKGLESMRLNARLDDSSLSRGYLAWALGRAGEIAESRRLLADLELQRRSTFIRPAVFAEARLGLGEYDTAIAELERELDSGGSLLGVSVVPHWQALRPFPGFAAVLRRAKLDL